MSVSFYAVAGSNFSASSNILQALIKTGTAEDQGSNNGINGLWTGTANTALQNLTITTSLVKYQFTFTMPATTKEFLLAFLYTPTGTAGANDYFQIENVIINEGPAPAAFQIMGEATQSELDLCQRYYQRIGDKTNSAIQYFSYGQTGQNNVTHIPFRSLMRTTPTMAVVGTWTVSNCSQPGLTGVSSDGFNIYATTTATGWMGFYNSTASTMYLTADAEL